jgi:myb proto-oncogene protein
MKASSDAAGTVANATIEFLCCSLRNESLDPVIDLAAQNKGKWTQAENANLIVEAVKEHGNKWVLVAALVPGRTKRQCSKKWVLNLDPDINFGKWTVEEDAKLADTLKERGSSNWAAVAALVPGRTNKQCRNRWSKSLDPDIIAGKWTVKEDAKLTEAVTEHGNTNWILVAALVPNRTNLQCRSRWFESLDPDITAGRWTVKEDAKLTEAVKECGSGNWAAVAALVPGRTNTQCRRRWDETLDPDINAGKWTVEEDAKLADALKECGSGNWAAVAALVSGRTNTQCRRRCINHKD